MNFLLIVLGLYLLGVIIDYVINLQDLEKFSEIAAPLINPQASNLKKEKVKAKLVYAIVAFFGALTWPAKFFFRSRRIEEAD